MNIADSAPVITGKASANETIDLLENIEEPNLQDLPLDEFRIRPNRDDTNQTVRDYINGESNVFEIKLDPMPLRQYLVQKQLVAFQRWAETTHERFRTLQKWEGYVIETGPETFRAKLVPILGESSEMEAEIYLEDISEEDRVLIEPGAVFYWSIGYLDRPSGRRRESIIRFRRLTTWTKQELEAVDAKVAELRGLFDTE